MAEPVDITAIYRQLGISPGKQGYDVASLCDNSHGRTSVWARNKPVRHPSVLPLTAEQLREVNHGLRQPATVLTGQPLDAAWRRSVWAYAPPRGAEFSEPYRLSDWQGYNPNVQPPISTPGTLYITPLDTTGSLRFSFSRGLLSEITDIDNLTVGDFAYIDTFYPCVVLSYEHEGTTYARCITAPRTFAEGGRSVSIPAKDIQALGKDKFAYFMCGASFRQSTLGIPPSGVYVVLPCSKPLEGEIHSSDTLPISVSFERVRVGGLGSAVFFGGYDVDIYNPLGSIKPFDPNLPIEGGVGADTTYKYLNVGTKATVSFRMAITNRGTSRITIPSNALYCRVVRNLTGETTRVFPIAELRGFNGQAMQSASSIVVDACSTAIYAIAWPDYCCVRNANGTILKLPDTRRFNAGFQLLLNSNNPTTLGSVGINISNY